MKAILFILTLISSIASASATGVNTHHQLCKNIIAHISENCSIESDATDPKTGQLIKRTKKQCIKEDLQYYLKQINSYLIDELEIPVFDTTEEIEQIQCSVGQ